MPIQGNILSELLYLFVIVIELQANKRGRVELVPSTQYITSAINFQIYLKDSTTMYSATQSQRNNSTGYWMTCSWSTSLQGMLNSRIQIYKHARQSDVNICAAKGFIVNLYSAVPNKQGGYDSKFCSKSTTPVRLFGISNV